MIDINAKSARKRDNGTTVHYNVREKPNTGGGSTFPFRACNLMQRFQGSGTVKRSLEAVCRLSPSRCSVRPFSSEGGANPR
ncbi:hypothetical protein [Novosphingobium sp. 9U]|uniref:hypothetical protein n=1 Tax=Novosphingobium sp. 9U TaxID=2653158 RepID=UPI00135C8E1E|nr:hypothetical protein [Novosphingobium sp. 9U]